MTAFETALENCIEAVHRGASVDECLKEYPEHAPRLAPLLMVAQELYAAPRASMSSAGFATQRDRMRAALGTREPGAVVVNGHTNGALPLAAAASTNPAWWRRIHAHRVALLAAALVLAVVTALSAVIVTSAKSLPPEPLRPIMQAMGAVRDRILIAATPTAVPVIIPPATATPTPTLTATASPSATPSPSATSTPVPPTATPVPPTATRVPPTATPVPTDEPTPQPRPDRSNAQQPSDSPTAGPSDTGTQAPVVQPAQPTQRPAPAQPTQPPPPPATSAPAEEPKPTSPPATPQPENTRPSQPQPHGTPIEAPKPTDPPPKPQPTAKVQPNPPSTPKPK